MRLGVVRPVGRRGRSEGGGERRRGQLSGRIQRHRRWPIGICDAVQGARWTWSEEPWVRSAAVLVRSPKGWPVSRGRPWTWSRPSAATGSPESRGSSRRRRTMPCEDPLCPLASLSTPRICHSRRRPLKIALDTLNGEDLFVFDNFGNNSVVEKHVQSSLLKKGCMFFLACATFMHYESIVISVSGDVMNERMWNESRLSSITQYHLSKSFITLSIYKIKVLFSNVLRKQRNKLINWNNEKVESKRMKRLKYRFENWKRSILIRLIINYQRERATNAFQRRRRGICIGKWCSSVSGIEWPKGTRPCTASPAGSDPANVSPRLYLEACWSRPLRGCRSRIPVHQTQLEKHFERTILRLKSLHKILLEFITIYWVFN